MNLTGTNSKVYGWVSKHTNCCYKHYCTSNSKSSAKTTNDFATLPQIGKKMD